MSNNPDRSLKTVVESYYTDLYRFAYSLAKNKHEAGDLTQQTFLIYAKKGATLRDGSKLKSWLFTTLYREFLRIRRRGSRETMMEPEQLEFNEQQQVASVAGRVTDGAAAVEALQQVDEVYRAPLTLFYLEDLSYKEIAETLDVPVGTVMSRLSRGKAQLRSVLLSRREKEGSAS